MLLHLCDDIRNEIIANIKNIRDIIHLKNTCKLLNTHDIDKLKNSNVAKKYKVPILRDVFDKPLYFYNDKIYRLGQPHTEVYSFQIGYNDMDVRICEIDYCRIYVEMSAATKDMLYKLLQNFSQHSRGIINIDAHDFNKFYFDKYTTLYEKRFNTFQSYNFQNVVAYNIHNNLKKYAFLIASIHVEKNEKSLFNSIRMLVHSCVLIPK